MFFSPLLCSYISPCNKILTASQKTLAWSSGPLRAGISSILWPSSLLSLRSAITEPSFWVPSLQLSRRPSFWVPSLVIHSLRMPSSCPCLFVPSLAVPPSIFLIPTELTGILLCVFCFSMGLWVVVSSFHCCILFHCMTSPSFTCQLSC